MNTNIFLQSQSDPNISFQNSNQHINYHNHISQTTFKKRQQILPAQCSTIIQSNYIKQKDASSNKDSSKKHSSLLAGKKARQRKKKYFQTLQLQVKDLQNKIQIYDLQIKKTKQTLAQTLNSTKNNQNSITYSQLQLCIQSEDPNQDKINLLLDMMKNKQFRIGAVGNQRQAKIQYYFKQLVTTLFPALHRYLMYCSENNIDLFKQNTHDIMQFFNINNQIYEEKERISQEKSEEINILPWIKPLLDQIDMTQKQKNQFFKMKSKFITKNKQVKNIVLNLKQVKQSIKKQQTLYEDMIDEMRNGLSPVQGAIWILLSQKYKYKRQISMQNQIQLFLTNPQTIGSNPIKKRKVQ